MLFKVIFDIAVSFFKMRINGLILIVKDVDPLMFLDLVAFNLVLDFE